MCRAIFLCLVVLILLGCNSLLPKGVTPKVFTETSPPSDTTMPTNSKTMTTTIPEYRVTPTEAVLPTITPFPHPITTPILPDLELTLTPYIQSARVFQLYKNPPCELPCFWNIRPGETSWQDAERLFHYLGAEPYSFTDTDLRYTRYGVSFSGSADDLQLGFDIYVQDEIIEYMGLGGGSIYGEQISTFKQLWAEFEPKKIMAKYGVPTKAWITTITYGDRPSYVINLLFSAQNLFYSFSGRPNGIGDETFDICPTFEYGIIDSIFIWVQSPFIQSSILDFPEKEWQPLIEPKAIPFENMVDLSLGEFHDILINGKSSPCFSIPITD